MATASQVLPMLRCSLPASCTLQHRRGERIWEPQDEHAQAEAQSEEKLLEQMKALTLSPPVPPSAVSAAASSSAASTPNGSPSKDASAKLSKKERKAAQKLAEQANAAKRQAAATLLAAANSAATNGSEHAAESAAAAAAAVAALPDSSASASAASAASPSKAYWTEHPSELSAVLDGVATASSPGLEFGAECSSKDRVVVHSAAAARGLDHESLGFRPRRHLYVTRAWDSLAPSTLLLAFRMGHLYLEGPAIDAIGARRSAKVDADPAFRAHRLARDGVHYHATILHSSSVDALRDNWPECLRRARAEFEGTAAAASSEAASSSSAVVAAAAAPSSSVDDAEPISARLAEEILLRFFAARLSSFAAAAAAASASSCGPTELGLGRACSKDGLCVAFYRVLSWPEVDRVRAELGLDPADLHVTVGFKTADVHGVKKGATTLCELEEDNK